MNNWLKGLPTDNKCNSMIHLRVLSVFITVHYNLSRLAVLGLYIYSSCIWLQALPHLKQLRYNSYNVAAHLDFWMCRFGAAQTRKQTGHYPIQMLPVRIKHAGYQLCAGWCLAPLATSHHSPSTTHYSLSTVRCR